MQCGRGLRGFSRRGAGGRGDHLRRMSQLHLQELLPQVLHQPVHALPHPGMAIGCIPRRLVNLDRTNNKTTALNFCIQMLGIDYPGFFNNNLYNDSNFFIIYIF